jgi:hypothetical protein
MTEPNTSPYLVNPSVLGYFVASRINVVVFVTHPSRTVRSARGNRQQRWDPK